MFIPTELNSRVIFILQLNIEFSYGYKHAIYYKHATTSEQKHALLYVKSENFAVISTFLCFAGLMALLFQVLAMLLPFFLCQEKSEGKVF